MDIRIDRAIPVPIASQIKGQIEYGVTYGLIEHGSRLPNVRELAKRLQVSPATVSQAYQDLHHDGILVSAPGRGTYVSEDLPAKVDTADRFSAVEAAVGHLAALARDLDIDEALVLQMLSRRLAEPAGARPLRIAFVGEFTAASEHYVEVIRRYIGDLDTITVATFAQLAGDPQARAALTDRELVLTLAHKVRDLRDLMQGGPPVEGVRFIPSAETRAALATVDPLERVGLLAVVPEFLAVLKAGVQTFAPHLAVDDTALVGTPRAAAVVERSDVLVYASGSEPALTRQPLRARAIEYRHTPDPAFLVRSLVPRIEALRERGADR